MRNVESNMDDAINGQNGFYCNFLFEIEIEFVALTPWHSLLPLGLWYPESLHLISEGLSKDLLRNFSKKIPREIFLIFCEWIEKALFPSNFRVQLKSLELSKMTGTEIDLVN